MDVIWKEYHLRTLAESVVHHVKYSHTFKSKHYATKRITSYYFLVVFILLNVMQKLCFIEKGY